MWREMCDFYPDAVLLVLTSELYDESDYIRNYDEYLDIVKKVICKELWKYCWCKLIEEIV